MSEESKVGEQLKANRRMAGWAQKPDGKAYRLIRAFLIAADGRDWASAGTMRQLCGDKDGHPELYIELFDHWLSDLKTETGNASGKVFEQEDGSDRVTIWAPIRATFDRYKDQFLA